MITSSDGRCKSFDASADGYGKADGAGIVVLKVMLALFFLVIAFLS